MRNFEEDFKEWYLLNNIHWDSLTVIDSAKIHQFKKLPLSMQWGVYVDFFIEKDLMVEVTFYWGANYWDVEISEREIEEGKDYFRSRLIYEEEDFKSIQEARKAALEQAIEIYENN